MAKVIHGNVNKFSVIYSQNTAFANKYGYLDRGFEHLLTINVAFEFD